MARRDPSRAVARRVGGATRVAASLIALAAIVVGLPYALVVVAGSPIPNHLPTRDDLTSALLRQDDGSLLLVALTYVVWIAWAVFVVLLVIEAAAQVRGRRAPHIPGLRGPQQLAALLIGGISAFIVGTSISAGAGTLPSSPPRAMTVSDTSAHPLDHQQDDHDPQTRTVVTVHAGDSLWAIAQNHLPHNASDEHVSAYADAIFHHNDGLRQPDGRHLSDRNRIYPGWRLRLPAATSRPHRSQPQPRTGTEHRDQGKPHPSASATSPAKPTPTTTDARPSGDQQHHDEHQSGDSRNAHPTATRSPVSVALPSGGVVGLAFVTGIGAALAAARLHRQRRYDPRPPVPGTVSGPAAPDNSPLLTFLHRTYSSLTRRQELVDDSQAASDDSHETRNDAAVPVAADEAAGYELPIDLAAFPGLGLTGDGASDAARAILTTLLLGRRRGHEVELVLTRDDAATLLGPIAERAERGDISGVVITQTFDAALARVQSDVLHRARLVQDADAEPGDAEPDEADETPLTMYRRTHPDHVLPTVVLAAELTTGAIDLVHGVLTAGRGYDVSAVLLGDWPYGETAAIDAGGEVATATEALAHLRGSRLFGLTVPDITEVFELLAAAAGNDASPVPAPRDGTGEIPALPGRVTDSVRTAESRPQDSARPVRLNVLGSVQLHAAGKAISKGVRRTAYEVLAYLATHPDGVATDRLLEDLWPDHTVDQATRRLHDANYSLRNTLRPLVGAVAENVVTFDGERYRLDADVLDVDLWRFTSAYEQAAREHDEHARLAMYEAAADAYRGNFADNIDGIWAETVRETLPNRALDVLTGYAELSDKQAAPENALASMERAAELAPYDEAVHRRRILLLGELGRADAAKRVHEAFERRLDDDLEATPDPETEQVVQRVIRGESDRSASAYPARGS